MTALSAIAGAALHGAPGIASAPAEATGESFGAVLNRAVQAAIDTGHEADRQAATAIAGGNNITEAVTSVSKAELALQAVGAIRDHAVQACQDVMKMPI